MLWAIALATPFFVFFGWLSDKIGRKWIMMAGMLLGVITYRPIFNTFLTDSNAGNWNIPPGPRENFVDLKPTGITPLFLSDTLKIVKEVYISPEGEKITAITTTKPVVVNGIITYNDFIELKDKHLSSDVYWKFVGLVFLLILFVTMVYGPIAAFLVEMFPTKIRYTSMSLPYHIGNGVFGGLTPYIALLLTTIYTKDNLVGLWYPIGVAAICLVIGVIYLRNKIDKDVTD